MSVSGDTLLVLADGRIFRGRGFGARTLAIGEVVFNTALTGYQEILTDPSYHEQLICMTQPHIGVYGVNDTDIESRDARLFTRGFIVRDLTERHSNFRATASLSDYLARHNVAGISELDTRALTRRLRDHGSQIGAIAPASMNGEEILRRISQWGTMEGRRLIDDVTCAAPYTISAIGTERFRVAAYDFGSKQNIYRHFASRGVTTTVYPAHTPATELLASDADGFFLSNGPGDPAACAGEIANVAALLGHKPLFGICLGHQFLALAAGAETFKLPFGHHGANHPVKDLTTGKIEITSQNHGFAVDSASLTKCGAVVTHTNLNDGSNEGFAIPDKKAFSVQYHPEAAPGPRDAEYLFDRFVSMLKS